MGPHSTDGDSLLSVEGVQEPSSHDCPPHGTLTTLGADQGNNEYYRCESCRAVVVDFGTTDYREVREERDLQVERSWLGMASVKHDDGRSGEGEGRGARAERGAGFGDRLAGLRRRLLGR